jgi:hypothetical protein
MYEKIYKLCEKKFAHTSTTSLMISTVFKGQKLYLIINVFYICLFHVKPPMMIWRPKHVAVFENWLWKCIFNTCAFVGVKYLHVQVSYPAIPYRIHKFGAQLLTTTICQTHVLSSHSSHLHNLSNMKPLHIFAPSCFYDNFNITFLSKPVPPTWSLWFRLSYQTECLTSHTLTRPATQSSYTVPCTKEMYTRLLQHRHMQFCRLWGELKLQYPSLSHDTSSDLTSPYRFNILVLKIFYWRLKHQACRGLKLWSARCFFI